QEVSIVGFDDVPLAAAVYPALTTVAQPIAELGRRSVRLLLDRMGEPAAPFARSILPVTLVERESSAAPRPNVTSDGATMHLRSA
ncbi:MAG: substrate-binding domain-containing protein, partial [Chloroflexota bacterium]|nr:substrate-binding domain-containing protein [Chloroflexota bacterium]